jgi:hypothetical protein
MVYLIKYVEICEIIFLKILQKVIKATLLVIVNLCNKDISEGQDPVSVNGIDVKDYDILVAVQISKEFSYDNIRITKERTNYTEWKGRTPR